MSGYGFLDGTMTGISSDVFMKNMDTFDFPMESLEGDDLNGGYWDAKLQSLVPILSGVLTGSPLTSGGNICNAASVMVPGFSDPNQESTLKSVPNSVEEAFRASMPHHNNYSDDPVSVLGCRSSCSSATKSLSMSSEVISGSKRSRFPTIYPNCSAASEKLSLSSEFSESNPSESIKKLVRRLKKKKKLAQLSDATEIMQRYTECKKCSHCEVSQMPQWRDGPMGRNKLCNACGVRYRSGRLFAEYRPVASPTIVSSLYSNRHKEVVEMREKVQDFVPITSEVYLGLPLASGGNVGNAASVMGAESSEVKPKPNVVEDSSRTSIFLHNNYPNGLDSGALQTPNPVSVHQSSSNSSSSCSNEMCMSVSSGIVTRSMRSRFSTINPPRFAATRSKGFSKPDLMITKQNLVKTKPKMYLKLPKLWDTTASKKCLHCGSKKTPQWRSGPMGRKTLCNACGVRYRSGRLFPEYHPVASPAFVPSVHSNSHRVVVQMRKNALQEG